MASIGASCAGVYVMQKRQIEKMERKEAEERARSGESGVDKDHRNNKAAGAGRNKKVHPGSFPATESTRNQVETNE
ncbi:hypothetical protein L484_020115 [Morus notabilis]|uniref:Uncharacterized protein n=1 Tax=Morus notabilis TaxID=981085 RepID=W9RB88_9ROSA|nr:hypothetical protein L484_020115 [Morus notabilis]